MLAIRQIREPNPLLRTVPDSSAAVQPQLPSSIPSSCPDSDQTASLPAGPSSPRRLVPAIYLEVERPPVSTYDDNPIFNERGAGTYLGLSCEKLKKWRQRDQGPDYIQFGKAGPVRYELNALVAFRAAHRVKVGANR
jgi:hypothetical protein